MYEFSSMSVPDNDSSRPVYEDFRQLIAFGQRGMSPSSGLLGWLKVPVNKGLEHLAGLLETRVAVYIGGCICLALVGVSCLTIQQREQAQSPAAAITDQDQAPTPSEPPESPASYDPLPFDSTVHATTNLLDPAFVVRVGSFRDPYNAARLARTLRAQAFDVRTGSLPGGLYVVELGPFPQRGAAEHAVQALRKDRDLSPQVVQKK